MASHIIAPIDTLAATVTNDTTSAESAPASDTSASRRPTHLSSCETLGARRSVRHRHGTRWTVREK